MRYRWDLDTPAVNQFHGLPDEAALAFVVFMDDLVEDPWDSWRQPGEVVDEVKNMRQLAFGGHGIVNLMIYKPHEWFNEDEGTVLVLDIAWAG